MINDSSSSPSIISQWPVNGEGRQIPGLETAPPSFLASDLGRVPPESLAPRQGRAMAAVKGQAAPTPRPPPAQPHSCHLPVPAG